MTVVIQNNCTIAQVLEQHIEEAVHLRNARSFVVQAPHPNLNQLERLDERIKAHLDALTIAEEAGRSACSRELDPQNLGAVFAAAVGAIEARDGEELDGLLALARSAPDAARAFRSALGWVDASRLKGLVHEFLRSNEPFMRSLGLSACAMHYADPGEAVIGAALEPGDANLNIRALRAAAHLGKKNLIEYALALTEQKLHPMVRYEAARCAVILGERDRALDCLRRLAEGADPVGRDALMWYLRACPRRSAGRELSRLEALSGSATSSATTSAVPVATPGENQGQGQGKEQLERESERLFIEAIGVAGDPQWMERLLAAMAQLPLARLAGQSFTLITGADLALLDLERRPPLRKELIRAGAPDLLEESGNVDEGLAWPDPELVAAWWEANKGQFTQAKRYFMGQTPTREHARHVLANARQRQRQAAAVQICLIAPGSTLFGTGAPAWQQRNWLEKN